MLFAGLAPGLPGVYQLNVIPKGPISNRVYLFVNGVESNDALLAVPAGQNVSNVSGSIDGLYPASGAAAVAGQSTTGPVSFSALLIASVFEVGFDIKPNAKPFRVSARNGAASDVIDIDPVQNTWRATITVLRSAKRVYDFSADGLQVIDFLTGSPFPGTIIPSSRLDPIATAAINALPPASEFSNGIATTTISGTLAPSRHFTVDPNTLSQVSRFGDFIGIRNLFGNTSATKLQLFVDGLLVASKSISFVVD